MNEISTQRNRRLALTLTVFTVFSVVASIVTAIAFVVAPVTKFDLFRAITLLVIGTTATLLAVLSGREVKRQ